MNEGNDEDSRIARVSLACPPPYHFHLVDEELKGQSLMRFKWEIVASHLQSQKAHGTAQNLSRVCGVVIVLRRSYRVTKGDTEGQNGGWHRAFAGTIRVSWGWFHGCPFLNGYHTCNSPMIGIQSSLRPDFLDYLFFPG